MNISANGTTRIQVRPFSTYGINVRGLVDGNYDIGFAPSTGGTITTLSSANTTNGTTQIVCPGQELTITFNSVVTFTNLAIECSEIEGAGGVQTGSGPVTGATERVTLATDSPGVAALSSIDNKLPAALENGRLAVSDSDMVVQPEVSVTSAAVLFTQDMGSFGLRSAAVQVTSAGTTCTITYEVSNNNVDWVSVAGWEALNTGSSAPSATSTTTGIRNFGVTARYFRARVSTYTSGTVTANAVYRSEPLRPLGVNVGNSSLLVLTRPATSTTADGSATWSTYVSNATNTQTSISGSAGVITGGWVSNSSASWRYIKLFNNTSITPGTTSALINIGVAPGHSGPLVIPGYLRFSTGIQMLITAGIGLTDNTSTGAANEVAVTFFR